jgi:hypothetical protein
MKAFPLQTALTLLTLAALLSGARLVLPAIHGPMPAQFLSIVDLDPKQTPLSPLVRHADPTPTADPSLQRIGATALLDDASPVLDHFYAALWRTEKKQPGAVTRIVHYGDSPTTADLITGDVRAILQSRYGDAGHGFILADKPWAWYQHTGAQITGSGWDMSRASNVEARDGLYGLACPLWGKAERSAARSSPAPATGTSKSGISNSPAGARSASPAMARLWAPWTPAPRKRLRAWPGSWLPPACARWNCA